jgi:hypothetical protein
MRNHHVMKKTLLHMAAGLMAENPISCREEGVNLVS